MTLNLKPNFNESGKRYFRAFTPGDDFYEALIDTHLALSDEQSAMVNAQADPAAGQPHRRHRRPARSPASPATELNGETHENPEKVHHVAYRCKDAKETVEWYGKYLNMGFILAIAEDEVPSTGSRPYMHVFLDAGGGNVLAFFELPTGRRWAAT
jgi:hypothetical protein